MENLSKNFKASEFSCKCGCGYCAPAAKLILSIQAIRDKAGASVSVTSGCRCTEHNAKYSAVKGLAANLGKGNPGDKTASAHTLGEAADFRVKGLNRRQAYDLIVAMHKAGELPWLKYTYMLKSTADVVHIDTDGSKRRSTVYGGEA